MAIQTRGFGVDVMPHYTPVDPNLVALHPEQIADGVLKAFQVANEDEKLRAFKHLNDEIQALRSDRMAAAKSRYNMDVTRDQNLTAVSPTSNQATIAGNLKTIQLAPKQTVAESGRLDNIIALQPGEQTLALGTQGAQLASAEDTNAALQNRAAVGRRDSENAVDNMDVKAEVDRDELASRLADAHLKTAKAESDLQTYPDDKKAKTELTKAQTELAKAQADQAKAHGLFYANGGAKNEQIMKDLNQTDAGIARILKEYVVMPDGNKGTLADYINEVHVNGGKEVQETGHLWWKAPMQTNPQAEELMQQLQQRYQMREKLLNQVEDKVNIKTAPAPVQTIAPITVPKNIVPGAPSSLKAPDVRYSPDGKAWIRDASGKVVPYNG